MSSLLDVLHKRPSRTRGMPEPGAAPELAPPEEIPDQATVELRLASEADPTLRTLTMRHPSLPSAHGTPAEGETLRLAEPVPATDGPQVRRWSDPPAPAVAPAVAPARAAGRPHARRRLSLLLAALVAVAAVLGYAAYNFTGGAPAESFLAAPGQIPAPPAGVDAAQPAATPASQPVPVRKVKRSAASFDDSDGAPQSTGGETAWYDQPALPAEASQPAVQSIQITHETVHDELFDKLRDAYGALQAGDAARAEPLYREVLTANPGSVDALLGLASLAARGGRMDESRDLFRQVQRLDPKNGTAAAALSAMPGGNSATDSESGLKGMLREQPDSAPLQFALGLRYASDQRWPDAQAAFFEAVRHDPTNADYAFNLAVALDRMGQVQVAASYYQRAIDLASGSHQFPIEAARERLATLRGRQG